MKYLWILFILLFLVSPALAEDNKWTKADTARQLTFTAITGVDWLQTKEIARNPKYYETNPYLGKYPSQRKVDTYFAFCVSGHAIISYLLPTKMEIYECRINPREVWQYFWIGVEAGYVGHNYNVDIRIRF